MKDSIEYTQFQALDVRIGRVIAASAPDWSNKLLEFTVDFGEEIGERTILSGVRKWYQPDEFVGHNYVFIVNLAERKMGEGISQGMMLMADTDERPIILPVDNTVPAGTVIR